VSCILGHVWNSVRLQTIQCFMIKLVVSGIIVAYINSRIAEKGWKYKLINFGGKFRFATSFI